MYNSGCAGPERGNVTGMDQLILEKIQEAELLLIGLGEEFDGEKLLKENAEYREQREALLNAGKAWGIPALNRYFLENGWPAEAPADSSGEKIRTVCKSKQLKALECLASLLDGKNFFLVTVASGDLIWECGIRQDRITAPCGGSLKKQCVNRHIFPLTEADKAEIAQCGRSGRWADLTLGKCLECGGPMILNNIYAENYNEDGYLERWKLYQKWLSGTLNRKLCILELGVGMQHPGVIRFPFEKIAYYNRKADFIRVNESLYQLPAELKERGISVRESAADFLLGLPFALSCDKL